MAGTQHKRLIEAADFFNDVLRKLVVTERGIHAETIVASAARMAGTMLFRSFAPAAVSYEPGTVVLSEQANVKGPRLMNLMFATLRELGHAVGEDTIDSSHCTTQASQLTLREAQEKLDSFVLAYCKAVTLSDEEAAFALAVAAGILVHDCRSALDVQKGAAIAIYGFIEGSKTAPIPISGLGDKTVDEIKKTPKKPWWNVW